jgi:hypothetical protein
MKLLTSIIFLLFINFSFSQFSANFDFPVSCMGSELDGTITLESFGKGRNYADASEQAKKNAVMAVIFQGVKNGSNECSRDPLILNPNTRTTKEDYFDEFFKDNGEYLKYVSLKDEKVSNKVKRNSKKAEEFQQRKVVVRVDRSALKKRLKSDNIE